jgi:hypothetical protein
MTQTEIQKLATEIIGDGQQPNKFFVSINAYFINGEDEGFDLLERFSDKDSSIYVFDTLEEAQACYDNNELTPECGVGTVTIEDRLIGTLKEKQLELYMKPTWINREHKF